MRKSCFFIGHRKTDEKVYPVLQSEIERHITDYGVYDFIVGGYGRFDHLAARAVISAKQRHPSITLSLLLPYHPAERPIQVPDGFNNSFYPPGLENVPRRYAIVNANRYIVSQVDYLIAYVWHPASNVRNLLEYAKKREQQGLISVTILPR